MQYSPCRLVHGMPMAAEYLWRNGSRPESPSPLRMAQSCLPKLVVTASNSWRLREAAYCPAHGCSTQGSSASEANIAIPLPHSFGLQTHSRSCHERHSGCLCEGLHKKACLVLHQGIPWQILCTMRSRLP